jgi:hypothetical protein
MNSHPFKIVLLLAIIATALAACALPIGGGSGSGNNAVATVPAQQATQAVASTGKYFQEDFGGSLSNWSHFTINATKKSAGNNPQLSSGDFGTMTVGVQNGYLVFDLAGNGQWVYSTYDAQQYDDVRVDATVQNRGDNDYAVGLICRYGDQGWYEFDIANSGLYGIFYVKVQSGTIIATKLADGGFNKIHTGKDTNSLAIACQAHTLTLFINGSQIRSIDDNQFELQTGKIGVAVLSNTPHTIVGFDSVKVGQP